MPAAPASAAPVRVALVPVRVPTNPYAELLARAVTAAGAEVVDPGRPGWRWLWSARRRVDVLHLHWLHVFYRRDDASRKSVVLALCFAKMLLFARLLGYRLVWTMHNAQPHDSPTPLADHIAHLAAMNLSEVVIHCEAARPLLRGRKLFGGVHAIPHGSYEGVYPDTVRRPEARVRLGLADDRVVFLAFGLIRGYKGIRRLVESFASMARGTPRGDRATLLVVGRPREAVDREAVEALRAAYRDVDVRWCLDYVPDAMVQVYMRAADYAVAAFERILVSGSAILALSFGLPLVAPRLGSLPELVGDDAGILYEPPDGLAAALALALTADRAALAAGARRRAAALDWAPIGAAHVAVYRGHRPPRHEPGAAGEVHGGRR
ncbi:MAG: glycosyltransferase [Candidatus Eiseniibacteriota bacterium]|jgi:glycosyltransferase involved in cell wall biosynthesis